jgi:hypothetical protein
MLIALRPMSPPHRASLARPAMAQCIQSSGKIDASCVPRPVRDSSLRPDHDRTKPRKRSTKADHIRDYTPLTGLESPVRGYATALLCNARPVASGLALIRSRVGANPA